ncbi:PLDc N-terminal domain-containing protein [Candidatus Woesearchaeota archaeon]|nr:PLDc N-terminal domain-containing protein [Candidatus Woesearchaeota archaeon]
MMGYTGFWGAVALICAVWVIFDVFTKQKKMSDGEKIIWTICAVIFNIFTAIIYYLVVKRK